MEEKQIKYAIYFNYQKACWETAQREFEAMTNNPEKWLEKHNESRIAEGNEAEELWMFDIEEVGAEYIYKD